MWLERDVQLAMAAFGNDLRNLRPAFKLSVPHRRRPRRWPHLRTRTEFSMWRPIPFGVDDGRDVSLALAGRHLLVGGQTGGGKSVALSMICAEAAGDPAAELWLLDAKRLELAVWKRQAREFVGPDLEEATQVLRRIRDEIDARTALLEELAHHRGVPIRAITRDMKHIPLIVLVIDEIAEYTDRGKDSVEFSKTLRSIVSLGRAVGVIVVAATQKPQASVIPSELRDLFPYRFALRCSTPQMSETILGQGWAARGADASTLPERPGLGFLLAEDTKPRRVQTYFLTDHDLARLAGLGGECSA